MSVSFVNSGVFTTGGLATSISCPRPASIMTGNLLLAWVIVSISVTISVSGGWTLLDTFNNGSVSGAWAYRVSDTSTDTNATFSWVGNGNYNTQTLQYSGNVQSSPIGAKSHNIGSGTTITCASIVSTSTNAFVAAIMQDGLGSNIPPTPTNFSSDDSGTQTTGVTGSYRIAHQVLGAIGSSSDAISVVIASANWRAFTAEIIAGIKGSSRSMLAFWMGGAALAASTPTATSGNWLILARRRFRR